MMAKFEVIVDEEKCIGCAACTSVCDNFIMDDKTSKAIVKKSKMEEAGCNPEAQDMCPVDAIIIKEN